MADGSSGNGTPGITWSRIATRGCTTTAWPAERWGRIDINADFAQELEPEELEKLKALGYVSEETTEEDLRSDLFHTNAIAYNADLDQIALSVRQYNEIWIIDHSTTSEEAAGSSGGRWGRGG